MAYEAVKRAMTVKPGAEYRVPRIDIMGSTNAWPPIDEHRGNVRTSLLK